MFTKRPTIHPSIYPPIAILAVTPIPLLQSSLNMFQHFEDMNIRQMIASVPATMCILLKLLMILEQTIYAYQ